MPIYDFECSECGHRFETLVFGRDPQVSCERCGKPVRRLPSLFSHRSAGSDGQTVKHQAGSSCSSCHTHNCSSCGG